MPGSVGAAEIAGGIATTNVSIAKVTRVAGGSAVVTTVMRVTSAVCG